MDSSKIRFKHILDHVPSNSERVLDIGCVRHNKKRRKEANLHQRLVDHIDGNVIGIDVDKKEVEKMQREGHNVQLGDAEKLDFDERFGVIVAGEVIEHLLNPGTFLEKSNDVLVDGGRVVLSTPNPDGFAYFRKALFNQSNNPTHTCWIDPSNLKVMVDKIDGLCVDSWTYLPPIGGVSIILWKLGYKRASSPGYVAVLKKSYDK